LTELNPQVKQYPLRFGALTYARNAGPTQRNMTAYTLDGILIAAEAVGEIINIVRGRA
jgi:hypothetical protein